MIQPQKPSPKRRWWSIRPFTVGLVLFLICLGVVLSLWGVQMYPKRLSWTDFKLRLARRDIATFKDIRGRNPRSLAEINEYARENPDVLLSERPYGEFISNVDGNRQEHRVLNGRGGLFYDPNTGEVRVNITKPVKQYLRVWIGKKRNEIPAEW